jgi:soluble lytic murein transglycosylase-like protein
MANNVCTEERIVSHSTVPLAADSLAAILDAARRPTEQGRASQNGNQSEPRPAHRCQSCGPARHTSLTERTARLRLALLGLRPNLSESTAATLVQVLVRECKFYGYDPMLALAIATVESGAGISDSSHGKTRGFMQVLPSTGQEIARKLGIEWRGQRTLDSIEQNIRIAMWYLHHLESRFSDLELAIIAYNRGAARVSAELARGGPPSTYLSRVLCTYDRLRGAGPVASAAEKCRPRPTVAESDSLATLRTYHQIALPDPSAPF